MIYGSVTTQFLLMIYVSTVEYVRRRLYVLVVELIVVTIPESTAIQFFFNDLYINKRICALMILCFNRKTDYIDDFWVDNDSVFINNLYVNNKIYALTILVNRRTIVSMIPRLTATQFLSTIPESIMSVYADESKHQSMKQFHWWFLSRQRLIFCWWFLNW